MKVQATIRVINPVRQGVSAATGREWKSQELIVAWTEQVTSRDGREFDYENVQLVSLRGEGVERFAALNPQPGMVMEVDLAFGTRQYNGRVFNENVMFV